MGKSNTRFERQQEILECGTPTHPATDLVEEGIEQAISQSAQIVSVPRNPLLEQSGRLGALLRYPPADDQPDPDDKIHRDDQPHRDLLSPFYSPDPYRMI